MLVIITSHPIQYQAPLWRALASAGIKFEVWFLTPHAVKPTHDREFGRTFAWDLDLLAGYSHRFLPVKPGWRLDRFNGVRLTARWADEFRNHGVTQVWVEGWRFLEFWSAVRAAHQTGVEIWLRGETNDLSVRQGLRELGRRLALRWLFGRVSQFLCIGSANRRFYGSFGVSTAKLHPAPYSVDNTRFALAAEAQRGRRKELRAHWGILPDAFVFLFCGKLIAKKRPLDLVEAARCAKSGLSQPLHLLFAGDGELAGAVHHALSTAGVSGNIAGFLNQSEVTAAYAVADCLVLPSDAGETWGLVVNEALACDLPVIVSDLCGCAEDLAAPLGPRHIYACGDTLALAHCLEFVAGSAPPLAAIRKTIALHAPAHTVATVQALLRGTTSGTET